MSGHPIRHTLLVLATMVLSVLTIYGLWLYSLSLNSVGSGRQQTFWQLLQRDLAKKETSLRRTFGK